MFVFTNSTNCDIKRMDNNKHYNFLSELKEEIDVYKVCFYS